MAKAGKDYTNVFAADATRTTPLTYPKKPDISPKPADKAKKKEVKKEDPKKTTSSTSSTTTTTTDFSTGTISTTMDGSSQMSQEGERYETNTIKEDDDLIETIRKKKVWWVTGGGFADPTGLDGPGDNFGEYSLGNFANAQIAQIIHAIKAGGYATSPTYERDLGKMADYVIAALKGTSKLEGYKQQFMKQQFNAYKSLGSTDNLAIVLSGQDSLESAFGKSVSGKNNYGGIKASKGAPGTDRVTKEFYGGKYVTITAKFRDFASITEYCQFKKDMLCNPSGRYKVPNI